MTFASLILALTKKPPITTAPTPVLGQSTSVRVCTPGALCTDCLGGCSQDCDSDEHAPGCRWAA